MSRSNTAGQKAATIVCWRSLPTGATRLVCQSDGNLVLYQAGGGALWDSGTWGHPGSAAYMQDDGNLVVYASGRPVWDSGTCCR